MREKETLGIAENGDSFGQVIEQLSVLAANIDCVQTRNTNQILIGAENSSVLSGYRSIVASPFERIIILSIITLTNAAAAAAAAAVVVVVVVAHLLSLESEHGQQLAILEHVVVQVLLLLLHLPFFFVVFVVVVVAVDSSLVREKGCGAGMP